MDCDHACPGLISALPRPAMDELVKTRFALLLVGTALWLASILFVALAPS